MQELTKAILKQYNGYMHSPTTKVYLVKWPNLFFISGIQLYIFFYFFSLNQNLH